MGAPDILQQPTERSIRLRPLPDGNLKASPAGALTDAERVEIRAHKSELLVELHRQPLLNLPPAVRALVGLGDGEIERMSERIHVAQVAGYSYDDAEHIADQLLYRDRYGPHDLHLCLECRHLSGQRCLATSSLGAAPEWQPIRHQLHRCPSYRAKG